MNHPFISIDLSKMGRDERARVVANHFSRAFERANRLIDSAYSEQCSGLDLRGLRNAVPEPPVRLRQKKPKKKKDRPFFYSVLQVTRMGSKDILKLACGHSQEHWHVYDRDAPKHVHCKQCRDSKKQCRDSKKQVKRHVR